MRTRSSSIAQPPQPPSRPTSSAMGMSPETRYQYNLKVLRRRDPSIISILDQFSHVCVYHHNGERWEKNGYEGSMFLYERNSYPPYGFYILNRMGMDDHIQRLYPWDRITAQNSITMLRSFPSYSKNRSERIHEMFLPDERPDKFAEVYKWDKEKEQVSDSEMSESVTIGLWFYNTEGREPMSNVLFRLQDYIKQNIPYPEEFRYGPHKPPPTNIQQPSTPSQTGQGQASSVASSSSSISSSNNHNRSQSYSPEMSKIKARPLQGSDTPRASAANHASELDKLFAKLTFNTATPTPPSSSTTSVSPKSASSSKTIRPEQSTKLTIESLFASALPQQQQQQRQQTPTSASSSSSITSNTTGTGTNGLALLNTIFASASNNNSSSLNPPLSSSSTSTTFPNSTPSNATAASSSSSNPSSRAPSRSSIVAVNAISSTVSSRPISKSHSRSSLRHQHSQPRLVPPTSTSTNFNSTNSSGPETIQILSPIPTTTPPSVLTLTQEVMNGLLGAGGATAAAATASTSGSPSFPSISSSTTVTSSAPSTRTTSVSVSAAAATAAPVPPGAVMTSNKGVSTPPVDKKVAPQEAVKNMNVPALLAGLFAGASASTSGSGPGSNANSIHHPLPPGDVTPRAPVRTELHEDGVGGVGVHDGVNGVGGVGAGSTSSSSSTSSYSTVYPLASAPAAVQKSYFGGRNDMDYHDGDLGREEEVDQEDGEQQEEEQEEKEQGEEEQDEDYRDEDDDEIIELDFSDTRALSDMRVFDHEKKEKEKRKKEGRKKEKEQEQEQELEGRMNGSRVGVNGYGHGHGQGYGSEDAGGGGSRPTSALSASASPGPSQVVGVNGVGVNGTSMNGQRKKTRRGKGKSKDKEKEKERSQPQAQTEAFQYLSDSENSRSVDGIDIGINIDDIPPASPSLSPSPSPESPPHHHHSIVTPARYLGSPVTARPGDYAFGSPSTVLNGSSHNDLNGVKKESLLDALFASASVGGGDANISHHGHGQTLIRGREDLAREVVRLIQTDKAFVDGLWSSWQKRSNYMA